MLYQKNLVSYRIITNIMAERITVTSQVKPGLGQKVKLNLLQILLPSKMISLQGSREIHYQQSRDDSRHIPTTYTRVKRALTGKMRPQLIVATNVCYTVLRSCRIQDICIQHKPIKKQAFIFILSSAILKYRRYVRHALSL